jgi:hypothetical protein
MATGGKRSGQKGANKNPAGKKRARKSAGIGHNQPDLEVPPAQPNMRWYVDDQTEAQVARDAAARRQAHIAATTNRPVEPLGPHVLRDPTSLHAAMLHRVGELESTLARLPPSPHDDEINELKAEIARLKALPAAPAEPPNEAIKLESRLRSFAKRLASSMTDDVAKKAIYAAGGALWGKLGPDVTALADAIRAWLASLGLG